MSRFKKININKIRENQGRNKKIRQEQYISNVCDIIDIRARYGVGYIDICDMSDSFVDLKFVKEVYLHFKQQGFKVRFMPISAMCFCDALRVYW